jgi:MFS family permease
METLMMTFFLSGSGLWMADVMADAFVAQKAKLEPSIRAGNLQATCLAARFLGIFIAAPISTFLYSQINYGPSTILQILYVMPWIMIPLIWILYEERYLPVPSLKDQCQEIWNTACSRSVWQPLAFVYLFNLLQVSNAAWRQYLRAVLHFTDPQLNTLLVVSYALLYAGTVAYKIWFLHTSWRRLYQVGIGLNAFFSSLQLLLIRGHTFGLSPFWFALGDDALAEFVWGMQILPICIMLVELCPVGSEGASYAMFTTTWNSAMMLAPAISSSILLGIWDVSKATMEAGNLQG